MPHEWKTYTYGKSAVSVPSTWKVIRDYKCQIGPVAGTLFLGQSNRTLPSCPLGPSPNSVTFSASHDVPANPLPGCGPIRVNGLSVVVGPCSSSNPNGMTSWTIPSLNVEATAPEVETQTGPLVLGTDTSTIEGRVLHTLRHR